MNSERISTKSKMKLETIKKYVYEIRKTTQDMKQEYNKDMESFRKKKIKEKSWK
jgi:alkylhydroperoxidase/carboxymuconolactone decarboxylase family protein YurZ